MDNPLSMNETIRQCDTYLFDCDGMSTIDYIFTGYLRLGVLWESSHLFPGAVDILNYLRATNRRVLLITNNSTKSVEQYAEKCRTLGLPVSAVSALIV